MATQDPQRFDTPQTDSAHLVLREKIRFCHPGYREPRNTLLVLPRVDPATTSLFGIHHRTALVACQIIANNAFNTGHFTLDKDGRQRANVPPDGILTDRIYYFIVGDGPSMPMFPPILISASTNSFLPPGQYPVVPSFRDWEFPHARIPHPWSQVPIEFPPAMGRCAVTNFSICLEEAHLIPKEEATWYTRNGMNLYGEDLGDIDGPFNLVPLRSDIHKCFDNRWFAIVPKVTGTEVATTTTSSPQYVTHIFSSRASEYWPTYHNTRVQCLKTHSPPYIFARFAWTVLLHVKPFINSGDSRHIIRLHVSSDAEGTRMERKAEFLSGAELKNSYGGEDSKNATPRKRSAVGSAADDGNLTEAGDSSDSSVDGDFRDDMM